MPSPHILARHSAPALLLLATALAALPGLVFAQGQAQTQEPAAEASPSAVAAAPAQRCVQVDVHNLRAGQGHLMLAAYGSADSFGKKPLSTRRVAASEAQMSLQWCGLPGDSVALMGFQDLDSDGKMGRNFVGIPTEPWGSSGKPGSFGPSWDTGHVPLSGQPIVVRMSQ
jgi:uncharacterized protein (DUF2141 family)